jgi:hypothetical protein
MPFGFLPLCRASSIQELHFITTKISSIMLYKSTSLAVVALFALATHAHGTINVTSAAVARAAIPAVPDGYYNIYERACLRDADIRGIEVTTKSCQKAIDKLAKNKGYIKPPKTGCKELVTAGKCSISFCGNEAIKATVIATAAQVIHAECKPIGKDKKHVVAGTIMTHGFHRKDGSLSGPAQVRMVRSKLAGWQEAKPPLKARSEEDAVNIPTRVHAKDLHAPSRTLTARDAENTYPFTDPNGETYELVVFSEESLPVRALPSQPARELADDLAFMWGDERSRAESGGTQGTVWFGNLQSDMTYSAMNNFDLERVPENTREVLANNFQEFRRLRGFPWWFSVRVLTQGDPIGQLTMQVGNPPTPPGPPPAPPGP